MGKRQPRQATTRIFAATTSAGGNVVKGAEIDEAKAIDRRRNGEDVVVCGQELAANRTLAQRIEQRANGA